VAKKNGKAASSKSLSFCKNNKNKEKKKTTSTLLENNQMCTATKERLNEEKGN
jgi:hypothetical protein